MATNGEMPHIVVDESASPELRREIELLEEQIHADPELHATLLGLLATDRDVVLQTVGIIEQHPEGAIGLVRTWDDIITDKKKYAVIDFDSDTKEELRQEPEIVAATRNERGDPETRRQRVAGLWLREFATRVRDHAA